MKRFAMSVVTSGLLVASPLVAFGGTAMAWSGGHHPSSAQSHKTSRSGGTTVCSNERGFINANVLCTGIGSVSVLSGNKINVLGIADQ
jgi:hypothetical protein